MLKMHLHVRAVSGFAAPYHAPILLRRVQLLPHIVECAWWQLDSRDTIKIFDYHWPAIRAEP